MTKQTFVGKFHRDR